MYFPFLPHPVALPSKNDYSSLRSPPRLPSLSLPPGVSLLSLLLMFFLFLSLGRKEGGGGWGGGPLKYLNQEIHTKKSQPRTNHALFCCFLTHMNCWDEAQASRVFLFRSLPTALVPFTRILIPFPCTRTHTHTNTHAHNEPKTLYFPSHTFYPFSPPAPPKSKHE